MLQAQRLAIARAPARTAAAGHPLAAALGALDTFGLGERAPAAEELLFVDDALIDGAVRGQAVLFIAHLTQHGVSINVDRFDVGACAPCRRGIRRLGRGRRCHLSSASLEPVLGCQNDGQPDRARNDVEDAARDDDARAQQDHLEC
jgi:hypothetical protein